MKTTIVPAQVTTVEDKIAGNLGVSQLLLLTIPIFGGSILFVILPPFYTSAPYKIVLIVCLTVISGLLSIRIKGKILLFWVIVMLHYNLRPRYYVFDKNATYLRDIEQKVTPEETLEDTESKVEVTAPLPMLSTAELVSAENILTNPEAKPHFKVNRKGELSVHITEVQ